MEKDVVYVDATVHDAIVDTYGSSTKCKDEDPSIMGTANFQFRNATRPWLMDDPYTLADKLSGRPYTHFPETDAQPTVFWCVE